VLIEVLVPVVMVVADIAFLGQDSCRKEDGGEHVSHANLP
jgi:hypothetical protein